MGYDVSEWKPALLFEAMLPKKIEYYAKLQEVLESLFDPVKIGKINLIVDYFEGNGGQVAMDAWCRSAAQLFSGYSIYEVDGRFVGESRKPFDERVLVIRIIFHDPATLNGIDEEAKRAAITAIEILIGFRLSAELGTEEEIWVTQQEIRLKVWKKVQTYK